MGGTVTGALIGTIIAPGIGTGIGAQIGNSFDVAKSIVKFKGKHYNLSILDDISHLICEGIFVYARRIDPATVYLDLIVGETVEHQWVVICLSDGSYISVAMLGKVKANTNGIYVYRNWSFKTAKFNGSCARSEYESDGVDPKYFKKGNNTVAELKTKIESLSPDWSAHWHCKTVTKSLYDWF